MKQPARIAFLAALSGMVGHTHAMQPFVLKNAGELLVQIKQPLKVDGVGVEPVNPAVSTEPLTFSGAMQYSQHLPDPDPITASPVVKQTTAKDSFTLDSAYFGNHTADNQTYKLFSMEMQRGLNRLFETINENWLSDASPYFKGIYFFGASLAASYKFPTIYHEWGHFSRDRAMGSEDTYIYAGGSNEGNNTFFKYALAEVKSTSNKPSYVSYRGNLVGNVDSGPALEALSAGAGMNNQASLTDQYDEDFFFNERSSLFLGFRQTIDRLSPLFYHLGVGDDIDQLVSSYNSTGVSNSITRRKLKQNNAISLASGGTVSSAMAAYDFVTTGALHHTPLMVGHFLIPNQYNYFSTRGMSRKIQSGYMWDEQTKWVFGVEYIEYGSKFTEYNLGVQYRWSNYTWVEKLTLGDSQYVNLESSFSKKLTKNLQLGIYAARWDSRSLLGERNSLNLSANLTHQGGVRLAYLY